MFRFLRTLVVVLLLAGIASCWIALERGSSSTYWLQERIFRGRFSKFDGMIESAGKRYGVDPMLVKAIAWRESRFVPDMVGGSGERGLMQVTEAAGRDWARFEKLETFAPTDLFDPETNLKAGTWYVSKALERYKGKDDPLPFALGEYNAGRRRVERWINRAGGVFAPAAGSSAHPADGSHASEHAEPVEPSAAAAAREQVTGETYLHAVDFPSTRQYIRDVSERYRFYKKRGHL